MHVLCETCRVMLYGVLCVVACFVFVCVHVHHVKSVFVCFGDSLCDAASHVLRVLCVWDCLVWLLVCVIVVFVFCFCVSVCCL